MGISGGIVSRLFLERRLSSLLLLVDRTVFHWWGIPHWGRTDSVHELQDCHYAVLEA